MKSLELALEFFLKSSKIIFWVQKCFTCITKLSPNLRDAIRARNGMHTLACTLEKEKENGIKRIIG
jgi:hypothetical protein